MAKPRGTFQREPPPKAPSLWTAPLGGPSARARQGGWDSLARLLRSGVGVPESLRMLGGERKDGLSIAFSETAQRIEDGELLSEALSCQRGMLNAEELQMLCAAERVGDQAPVFEEFARELRERIVLRRSLFAKIAYPGMVLMASALIGPLPLALGGPGPYLAAVGLNFLGIALCGPGLVFGVGALARIPAINLRLRRVAWTWTWGTGVYRHRVLARFVRVLGRNLESGLPVFESIQTAANVTADPRVIEGAQKAIAMLRDGDALAPSLERMGLFTSHDHMQLVSAERSGNLDSTLRILASQYEEAGHRSARRVVTAVSGLATLAVTIYVAISVISGFLDAVLGPMEALEKEMPHLGR